MLVVDLSTLSLEFQVQRSKGQMLNKVIIAEVIGITYTHTQLNSGTASVPQPAAAPQSWGQMLSSWFLPAAPSIDKRSQTTSQPTSSSKKGNGTPSISFCIINVVRQQKTLPMNLSRSLQSPAKVKIPNQTALTETEEALLF